jgi:hypothetical protein
LSALYIAEAFAKHTAESNITELNLSSTSMQLKAGLFIGEALLANPAYPIERIKFKDVNLEESGLYRLLEAANQNKNIKRVHLGVVSDYGLKTMSELLKGNTSLLRLEFQESKLVQFFIIHLFRRCEALDRWRQAHLLCHVEGPHRVIDDHLQVTILSGRR